MNNGKTRVESFLSVGGQNFVEVRSARGWAKRVQSRFRGWFHGEYILLDAPAAEHEAAYLLKDSPCVVRFIHDGCACGFDSKILDWCDMGSSYFRVGWPKDIQVLHVRKHARIPANLPCTIAYQGDEIHGEVVDLSNGGCGIMAPRSFEDGAEITLSFTLPDGIPIKGLQAMVCRSRAHEQDFFLGCRFTGTTERDHSALVFHMSTTLHRMGLKPLADQRVLLVYPQQKDMSVLLHAFERAGVHVITAHNVVDAFYRLRMAAPGCLVLDVEQQVFSVRDVSAAIRQVEGFEATPLYLMGPGNGDQSLVSKCTATGWISHERLRERPDDIATVCLRSAVRGE